MKRTFLILFSVFIPILCSACSLLPVEEEPLPPPVIKAYESTAYQYFTVQKGTLTKYIDVAATKMSAHEESVYFNVNNILYQQINVKPGDEVKKGDILAELVKTDLEKALDDTVYEQSLLDIEIRQAEETYLLNKKYDRADESAYEKLTDSLNAKQKILQFDIDALKTQIEARTLVATMDGVITYLKETNNGDRSVTNEKFITITDTTSSLYVVQGKNAVYFKPGDSVLIKISTASYDFFNATVVNPEDFGVVNPIEDAAYITTGVDDNTVNNDTATVRYNLEEKKDALYLPRRAVNTADGKQFVYILKDDVREMLTIETGFEDSDGRIEIISGLKEGDSVVIS